MIPEATFKAGDYIIDSDQIFIVSKIDSERLYYKPINTNGRYQSVTGSIPIENIAIAGFRHLLTPKDLKNFLTELSKAKSKSEPIDPKQYKDIFNLNDPFKIIPLLRQLWSQKHSKLINFSGSNQDTLDSILEHLTDEFSLVTGRSSKSVRNRIINTLSNKKKKTSKR